MTTDFIVQVEKLAPPILMLSEVAYRYSDNSRIIFSGVDLSATMESRICIVGENGAGKNVSRVMCNLVK